MGIFNSDKTTTNATTNATDASQGAANGGAIANGGATINQDNSHHDTSFVDNSVAVDSRDLSSRTVINNEVSAPIVNNALEQVGHALDSNLQLSEAALSTGLQMNTAAFQAYKDAGGLGASYFGQALLAVKDANSSALSAVVGATQSDGKALIDANNVSHKYILYAVIAFAGVAALRAMNR